MCIKKSLQGDVIQCPICRKVHQAESAGKIAKNYSFSALLAEFQKVKVETDTFEKTFSENSTLKQQIHNLKSYLEINTSKLRIAEAALGKKKIEVEKLQNEVIRIEKNFKFENKCKMHNSIIVKLEMEVLELTHKLRRFEGGHVDEELEKKSWNEIEESRDLRTLDSEKRPLRLPSVNSRRSNDYSLSFDSNAINKSELYKPSSILF